MAATYVSINPFSLVTDKTEKFSLLHWRMLNSLREGEYSRSEFAFFRNLTGRLNAASAVWSCIILIIIFFEGNMILNLLLDEWKSQMKENAEEKDYAIFNVFPVNQ